MNRKMLSARSNCRSWRLECLAGTTALAAFMSAAQLTPSASPVSMNGRTAPITGRDQGQHDQRGSFAAPSELRETARQYAWVLPQRFCSSGATPYEPSRSSGADLGLREILALGRAVAAGAR